MARFITVLNSNLGRTFWKAVQWANSLQEIKNNRFYNAGVNMSLPKNPGDTTLEGKQLTETVTGRTAAGTIIRINAETVNMVKLANNTASPAYMKKTIKSLR